MIHSQHFHIALRLCLVLLLPFGFVDDVICQVSSSVLHFDQLTIKDGLSHNNVHCLLQDHNGYIWVGTQNGLNKYDGYDFEIYKSNAIADHNRGFEGSIITVLYEDNNDNLWVGTAKRGISIKQKSSDTFIQLQFDSLLDKVLTHEISGIYEDNNKRFWISIIGGGLIRYEYDSKTAKLYTELNSGLSSDLVFDVVQDMNGVVWAATDGNGINYLEPGQDQFQLFNPVLRDYPNMNGYRKRLKLDGNKLWLATEGTGLYEVNVNDKSVIRYSESELHSISSNSIYDILKTQNGNIFIGTNGKGLNVLNFQTKKINVINQKTSNTQALNSNSLSCLLEDHSGNIWIGTYNGGLNIYKPNKTRFDLVFPQSMNGDKLNNKSVLSLAEDNRGGIYIGTDGSGLTYMIPNFKAEDKCYIQSIGSSSLSGKAVKSIFLDEDDQIWLGIFNENTSVYIPETNQIHSITETKSVWSIDSNGKGLMALGTMGNGLNMYNKTNKKISLYQHLPEDDSSISSNLIMSVVYDNDQQLWIGTADKGLDRYDAQSRTFLHHQHSENDTLSLSSNAVRTVYQDSSGELWIGTEGGGLNRWLGDGRFEHINESHGLISNSVMGITEDIHHNIWVTTYEGLSRINPKTRDVRNFSFRSAQNLNQFNQMAALSASNDRLYFGGTNGLHSIRSQEVKDRSKEATVRFTGLDVSNKKVLAGTASDDYTILEEPIETAEHINLSYLDKSFSLTFSAFDFTDMHTQVYEYQMDGFDDFWKTTRPNQHSVSYTNLDPGNYTFKVRYGPNERAIAIHIRPPYWQTLWFKLLLILITIATVMFGLFYFLKRREAIYKRQMLQLEKEKLETSVEAQNSKLMFFAVQMAHKNEVLTGIKEELKTSKDLPNNKTGQLINKLQRELKNENYWDDFNLYFNKVDKHFVTSIQTEYPSLTSNDIRMCSLIRINLSNKEIASLCNISIRGVEQSKYRLKKRLKLNKEEDLARFISLYNAISEDS